MGRILTTKANKRKKLIESSIDFSFPCASVVKTPPGMQETQEMQVWSLDPEDSLKEKMATHSSILTWEVPWTEELGGLESKGLRSQTRLREHTNTKNINNI